MNPSYVTLYGHELFNKMQLCLIVKQLLIASLNQIGNTLTGNPLLGCNLTE